MTANLKGETAHIAYDPAKLGYSVINEAPQIHAIHQQGEVYYSEAALQKEIDQIFMKEWLLVGRVEEIAKPGDYFTLDVADEPVVVVREKSGNIQAFANVCRHRGVKVAWGSGNKKYFSCPYHGWVYDTSGKLVDAQYLDKSTAFDKSKCGLPRIKTDLWEGFIFIRFEPEGTSLLETLNKWGFPKVYGPYGMGRMKLARKFALTVPCNWKFLNENLTDIYHIAVLHSQTFGPSQPLDSYRYELFDGGYHGRFVGGTLLPDGKSLFGPIPWLPEELRSGGFSSHLPPNTAWFPRFDHVAITTNWPLTVDTSLALTYQLFPAEHFEQPDFEEKAQKYADFYAAILGEDTGMVTSLQRGIKSRYYEPGPASSFEASVMQLIKHNVTDLSDR